MNKLTPWDAAGDFALLGLAVFERGVPRGRLGYCAVRLLLGRDRFVGWDVCGVAVSHVGREFRL